MPQLVLHQRNPSLRHDLWSGFWQPPFNALDLTDPQIPWLPLETRSRVGREFIDSYRARGPQAGGLDVTVNLLLTTLAVAAAIAPFNQTDWPQPRARAVAQAEQAQNFLPLRAEVVALSPFAQLDWPASPKRIAVARVVPEQAQNLFGTVLAPAVQPFAQTDWPSFPRASSRQLELVQQPFVLTQPAEVVTPFTQLDWPVPVRVKIRAHEQVQQLLPLIQPAAQAPFAQLDWSVARAVDVPLAFESLNLLTTTLAPAPVVLPFSQLDWPTPPGITKFDLYDPPNTIIGTALPPVVVPLAPVTGGWPIPRPGRIRHRIETAELPPKVADAVRRIAKQQVEILSLDEQQRLEHASRELLLTGLAVESAYLLAIAALRERLIDEELRERFALLAADDEAAAILLLL